MMNCVSWFCLCQTGSILWILNTHSEHKTCIAFSIDTPKLSSHNELRVIISMLQCLSLCFVSYDDRLYEIVFVWIYMGVSTLLLNCHYHCSLMPIYLLNSILDNLPLHPRYHYFVWSKQFVIGQLIRWRRHIRKW